MTRRVYAPKKYEFKHAIGGQQMYTPENSHDMTDWKKPHTFNRKYVDSFMVDFTAWTIRWFSGG